jgi:predicted helicase
MPNTTHSTAPVRTAHELAQRLAQVARRLNKALTTLLQDEQAHACSSLHQQLAAFRQTLPPGMTPSEFADMYAQTLVYGLFTARVTMLPGHAPFTRDNAIHAIPKTSRLVQEICQTIACPDLDERIACLVDECTRLLAHTNMEAVLRNFGRATQQADPVVHFYEYFLAAYDPKMRDMRGVYYTPQPVVDYIVRSVDYLLRTRFGRPMGLADERTLVLDPATGTATFLHAVVQHIHATLQRMGMADGWQQYVATRLLPRLHGFELLPAPYTIAHLKLGLLLQQSGYSFGKDEHISIHLANALTAQEPLPSLHTQPVMVVLGNPPYANYGMLNKGEWIQAQLAEYKRGLQEKKLNLDDDFIKFMRYGQWRVAQSGQGILAFVTNNTYLDGITHRRMRASLMETFTDISILDLHGNSLKHECNPDGTRDENVFAIRQGVAIGLFVKEAGKHEAATVQHAELWGTRHHKYSSLASMDVATTDWQELQPQPDYFFFVPKNFAQATDYAAFTRLERMPIAYQGAIKTDRDRLVFAFDYTVLAERMRVFYSAAGLSPDFRTTYHVENSSSYELLSRRQKTAFNVSHLHRCLYRPFDVRWLYYNPEGFTSRPAHMVMQHMLTGDNLALLLCRQQAITGFSHVLCAETIVESHAVSLKTREGAFVFPLYLYAAAPAGSSDVAATAEPHPNLTPTFIRDIEQRLQLSFIPVGNGDLIRTIGPEDIFHYAYAVLHSPTYRNRYTEFLKIDFPRIPISSDIRVVQTLVAHGAALVDLHLLRLPGSDGVGGAGGASVLINPAAQGVMQHGVTTGPVGHVRYEEHQQRVVIGNGRYFAGVEPETWAMHIGSYQPLHKWLKDRKGRTLSAADALHYMRMVVALRETRRLMAAIDAGFLQR